MAGVEAEDMKRVDGWRIHASRRSLATVNPIRNFVQGAEMVPHPEKSTIRLDVGDPCVYGNLRVDNSVVEQLVEIARSSENNGYTLSNGRMDARQAVAEYFSLELVSGSDDGGVRNNKLNKEDVLLFVGASGALEAAIGAMCNEGDNILVPRPGFPLFQTLAEGMGVECRFYDLDPRRGWEIDLEGVEKLVDDRTAAWVINNPSNPCGSCFSREHLERIVSKAENVRVPIIADEIYHGMVFSATEFVPLASVNQTVPMLVIGGISKQFVVPGWRLGWILIYDVEERFRAAEVRRGLQQLSTRMLLPCSLIQALLPWLLQERRTPGTAVSAAVQSLMSDLEQNADLVNQCLATARGIRCIPPQGAMYMMLELDCAALCVTDDIDFTRKLYASESVYVLPGSCFGASNFVRIVITPDAPRLEEACRRIVAFTLARK